MTNTVDNETLREFDREVLRSSFASLFWAVISQRKRRAEGYTLQRLADALGVHKSTVSRWFSPSLPNWETDTISDIANALDLEIRVVAYDRTDGRIYTPTGVATPVVTVGKPLHQSESSPSEATGYKELNGAIISEMAA